MTLKDGTYTISSILPTNPVLDIAGPNPFVNPLAGLVCLSVFLKPNFFYTCIHTSQAQKEPSTPKANSGR